MDAAKLASIKPGVTTLSDLESTFGQPYSKSLDTSGKIVAMWIYVHAQSSGFGTDLKQQQLSVLIGTNNVVEKFTLVDTVDKPK